MSQLTWTFLATVTTLATLHHAHAQESAMCRWEVDSELPDNPPILYNTDSQDIVLPTLLNGQKLINVSSASHLEISCPGTKFQQWDTDSVRAQCKDGLIYVNNKDISTGPDLEFAKESAREESKRITKAIQELQNKLQKNEKHILDLEEQLVQQESNKNKMSQSSMEEFGCESGVSVTMVPTTTSCGGGGGSNSSSSNSSNSSITGHLHHLALLTANNFRTKILVCFNKTRRTTLWTKHTLHGAHLNAAYDPLNVSVSYDEFGFTHMNEDIDFVYRTDTQKFLFGILFITDKATAAKYFNVEEDLYLSPSLLSPLEDFVSTTEQQAAQAFINVAPVWFTVAKGNWEAIKESIRGYSIQRSSKLTVYSGVAGVKVVEGHKLHLGAIVGEKNAIPVPSLLWKVVIEESSNRAVGFLVYNDPHLKKIPKHLCPSVCSQLPWAHSSISNSSEDLTAGYTTCCTLPDLLTALPQAQADLRHTADWTLLT